MALVKKEVKYLNKDFAQFRQNLINFAKNYFPDSYQDFNESSPGMMFIEQASYISDVLSFYLDNQIQETYLQYAKQFENLYDLNFKSIKMVCNWLKIKMPEDIYNEKNKYDYKIQDLTHMSNCKRTSYLKQKKYNQTFQTNNGFINDLSIIDLIFNCGPNSIDYF